MTNKHLLNLYEIHQGNDKEEVKVKKIKDYFDNNLCFFKYLVKDMNEHNYCQEFCNLNIVLQKYISLLK